MGDGFSDNARENKRADERQRSIDEFFNTVTDYLGMNRKHYTIQGVCRKVEGYDDFIFAKPCSKAAERHPQRVREWMTRIEGARGNEAKAWAGILTEARMNASRDCFRQLQEVSPFAGKPVVILVPHGAHRATAILGDFREMHDMFEAGNLPFACTVRMPERAVKGMRQTESGWEESRESGFDDVRFISF